MFWSRRVEWQPGLKGFKGCDGSRCADKGMGTPCKAGDEERRTCNGSTSMPVLAPQPTTARAIA